MKNIISKILNAIVVSLSGLCELIGMLVIFLSIVGSDMHGENILLSIWNRSIGINGVFTTIVCLVFMLLLGYVFRYTEQSYWKRR